MMKYDDRAETIIKCEGLTFALAIRIGREDDIREARMYLKNEIVYALLEAATDTKGGLTVATLCQVIAAFMADDAERLFDAEQFQRLDVAMEGVVRILEERLPPDARVYGHHAAGYQERRR